MRSSRALALVALLGSVLTSALFATGPADAVADSSFVPRWCSSGAATPCLVSASRNGTPVTSSSSDWEIQSTGQLTDGGDDYFMWTVLPLGSSALGLADEWSLTFDTGTLDPDYTEAYAGQADVDRTVLPSGKYRVTYAAKPVRTTDSCDATAAWPWPCPDNAASSKIELDGEVHDKNLGAAWNGFDRSQSPDGVNGIFLETASDGSRFLSSEMVNSHTYTDGGATPTFVGEARFRMPYAMFKQEFEVPNPATMDAGSLSGVVRKGDGSLGTATFNVFHDPDGGAMIVDISGMTFSLNKIKLKRGVITPTRPTQVDATRTSRHRGFVDFDPSEPRGAKVTGYAGRCAAVQGDDVVTAVSDNIVRFTGLRAGVGYDCKVRAMSKAGHSRWSETVRMGWRPIDPS